jgi:hypothetical protein
MYQNKKQTKMKYKNDLHFTPYLTRALNSMTYQIHMLVKGRGTATVEAELIMLMLLYNFICSM